MRTESEKAQAPRNGVAPVPVRAINDVSERVRARREQRARVALDAGQALRGYLLNPTVDVPSEALEEALSANVQLLKALAELKRDRGAIGLQLRLKVRLQRVSALVGAALGHPPPPVGQVLPRGTPGAGLAERDVQSDSGTEKFGQDGVR